MINELKEMKEMKGLQLKSEAYLEPKRVSIIIIIIIVIIIINLFHVDKYEFLL